MYVCACMYMYIMHGVLMNILAALKVINGINLAMHGASLPVRESHYSWYHD